ncbi:ShlB/FhaC/HecB family hemolysin secretion/activation protein [Candidatus Symbiopectobacterium sp. NZEC135]|uniref:ShlB/FhaC/HecB family hemolysin secretion/activation protein n=1 Tax=Candidatus Symbiopectobacterium sp. NZEC135 TaxID=2820471 RepID=UPI0022265FDC|nr:ShlB/FhaC/HecB family hemolysin secretion/activation protein [Candidatus Symbiopectobacterium sp. NZEC135]
MRRHFSLINLFALGICSAVSHAESMTPADRALIEQQQKNLLEQTQRQREALQNSTVLPTVPEVQPVADDAPCYRIQKIELQGVTVLSSSVQQTLTASWAGQCMRMSDIQALVRSVSQAYLQRGYITSQAWVPEQDISSGTLQIAVTEGRIESITQQEKMPLTLSMAFPTAAGNVLNLRDLEQGLEQLNRLTSQPVTIDIQPSSQSGYSRVVVVPAGNTRPLHVNLGADNSGSKATGTGQMSTQLTLDNPLQLADLWVLSASRDNAFVQDRRSRSLSGSLSVPYGYWLFSYQSSWNDFHQNLPFPGSAWRYEGMAQSHRLGAYRTLLRDGQQKLALDMSVTRRHTENRIAGQRLSNSSAVVSSVALGPHYSRSAGNVYFTINPSISQGLSTLGAPRDDTRYPDAPRAQFRKVSLNASVFYSFTPSLYYLTTAYGQTSPDNLYASERVTAGGLYSVRGFKEQLLSGNRGAYWRNEVNWQLASFPIVGAVSLTGAVDGGWVSGQGGLVDGGKVVGSALGLTLNGRWFTQSLMMGKPLAFPGELRPDKWVGYWQATVTL